jgi:hypothetical protein
MKSSNLPPCGLMSVKNNKTFISNVISLTHYSETKEQLEYIRIHKEYQFVKKRSLVSFLTNEKLNVEKHFHDRAVNMLQTISNFEVTNLNLKLKEITTDSLNATLEAAKTTHRDEFQRKSFESALEGLHKGLMSYNNDPILPYVLKEIKARTEEYKSLSAEDESKLLSLTTSQRKVVADMDKR